MNFLRERVDSFYELSGDLPDPHFTKSIHEEDSSDKFALPSKIFALCGQGGEGGLSAGNLARRRSLTSRAASSASREWR